MLKGRVLKNMGTAIIVSLVAFVLLGACINFAYVGFVILAGLIEGITKSVLSFGDILIGGTVAFVGALGALGIGIWGVYSILSLLKEIMKGLFCNVE